MNHSNTLLKLVILVLTVGLIAFGTRFMSGAAVFWSIVGLWVVGWLLEKVLGPKNL